MACALCGTRRPRRFCPGVGGDICTICCGSEREVSVECPLDCEYLLDARRHEKPAPFDLESMPNQEIEVTENHLAEHEGLLVALASAIAGAAADAPGTVDFDARAALEGLIRTWRTLGSGLYYESRPANPLAARLFNAAQEAVARFRREETESGGMARTRDADVLRMLAFLQRLEFDRNNGRAKGRAFLGLLRSFYSGAGGEATDSFFPLIVP